MDGGTVGKETTPKALILSFVMTSEVASEKVKML